MKILQVVSYYAPAWGYGGPPKVMYELAKRHVRNGHHVTVFTTDALDGKTRAAEGETELDGIRIHRFRNVSNWLAWQHKKFLVPGIGSALAREIASFDIVHVSDSRGWLTLQAHRHARRKSVPLVLSAFGSLGKSSGLRGAVKNIYDRRYVIPMVKEAAALVAQTAHEAGAYESFGADAARIAHVPLGVEPADFARLPERGGFRRRAKIGDDEKVMLFIGRIHPSKGLDFLLRGLATLREVDPSWRLVVVGVDNGALHSLRSLIASLDLEERVTFTGALYGADRLGVMADSDVFAITPAIYEETSLAALEAAAAGLPVVATEQSDVPGLAAAGGGAIVPRTIGALVTALTATVPNRAHARMMGARARKLVVDRFSWEQVTARLESVFCAATRSG